MIEYFCANEWICTQTIALIVITIYGYGRADSERGIEMATGNFNTGIFDSIGILDSDLNLFLNGQKMDGSGIYIL